MFSVTGLFAGNSQIPHTKASDAEFWYFFKYQTPVILDAIVLIMTSLQWYNKSN